MNALYDYVVKHGYAGIDIDEENTVDVETYVNFLVALGQKFKGANIGTPAARDPADHQDASQLKVSCTIGPLSCCFQSRGICKAAPYIDWAFLMLYDGLEVCCAATGLCVHGAHAATPAS